MRGLDDYPCFTILGFRERCPVTRIAGTEAFHNTVGGGWSNLSRRVTRNRPCVRDLPTANARRIGTNTMVTQILIVDDHPAVREGLAARIANQVDMAVCGEAADMAEALKLLDELQPDVLIVDVQLKNSDGLELVRRIKARNDAVGILVWSAFPDRIYAERALNAGALGYITTGRIVDAIRRIREGNIYLCEDMAQHLLSRTVGGNRSLRQSPIETLSDRELEVFRHIGHGRTTGEIAKQLHISPHTIETHRQRIKEKLNVETAAELTQTAVRWVIGKETA